jgi:predicted NBD/HSP70 family sugar kinase
VLRSSVPKDSPAHERVYEALRASGTQSQPQLAALTGLSLPAVIAAVVRLEASGLVAFSGERRGIGRPARALKVTPETNAVLGIDLSGSRIRAGLFDLHGARLRELETMPLFAFSKLNRGQALGHLKDIAAQFPEAKRAGICAPGIVTPAQTLERSWIFGLETLERRDLERSLELPVILENDARSAAWGELRQGHGTDNFALLIFAFGIGAGIVSGGHLLRGARGAAGELSYLPTQIAGFTDQPRMGALAYSFFETLRTVSPDPSAPNWEAGIFHAAAKGHKKAGKAVSLAVQHLALAVAGIITVLDPERIVLREEFPHTQELVLEPLRTMLGKIGLPAPLEVSKLGRDAGLIGIALLSAEHLERELLGKR